MLGRRSPQTSIFEGDQQYLDHVGEKNFYGYLARHRHELFSDEDFAGLYSSKHGRPSVPPSLLCTALVLQAYERCSDAEAHDRAAFDLRWKVALGVADREKPFAKSTLQLFRAQLLVHEKLRLPFERSLQLARRSGYLKSDGKLRAAVDTTNVLGRGAVRDTYNLIGDGIVKLMRVLAKGAGTSLEKWAAGHELMRYLGSSVKGDAAIDWSDPKARDQLLGELVGDAERVLELARQARAQCSPDGPEDQRLVGASEILSQVLLQDVERQESGTTTIRQGTSGDRICSAHDPEMRHGRKSSSTRFDGHKLAVAADVESQLITAVDVVPGSGPDETGSLELAQQTQATTGLEVEAVLGDCAYGSGANRERFAEAGMQLLAKVASRRVGEFFPKEDFTIDLAAMTCRCPAGQVTDRVVKLGWRPGSRGERVPQQAFRFRAGVCGACPLRTSCYKPGTNGRAVHLHPQEAALQAARIWQKSPAFDLFRKQRQVIEHRIARLVQLGMRQARYFGRGRTRFQALMAAAVANLTLISSFEGRRRNSASLPERTPASLIGRAAAAGRLMAWRRLRTRPGRPLRSAWRLHLSASGSSYLALTTPGFRPGF